MTRTEGARAPDPADIEMSSISNGVATPIQDDAPRSPDSADDTHLAGPTVEQVQTIWNPYKNRFRVLSSCSTVFGNGCNDSAPGALLANIEKHYSIGYGTVAILFVCNAAGFVVAAFFINALAVKLGRAKTLIIAEALLMLGYLSIILTPPFPVVAASFFVLGIGMAIHLAIGQVFCSNLADNTAILGLYQGCYGIGGIAGPLIATTIVSRGFLWSRYYIIQLCLAAFNLVFSTWSFWNYELESELDHVVSQQEDLGLTGARAKRRWNSFKRLVSNKPTVLGACFIFAYQGAEVAISGWIISFLVQFRRGDPTKVGFVTSGFWAGITVGRFTFSFLGHKIGERLFVFLVTFGALILELLIWFVPSIPGDSVAVAFSGLLLGPIYPCAVHIFNRLIPKKMQVSSLSLIASVGSSGGAIAPFITGILAQREGTCVLHPICITLFIAMGVCWWLLPRVEKKREE